MSRIYNTTRWKRLRLYQLSIEPLCRVCKRPATDVDHIKPISAGGEPWDMDNLASLCHEHHSVKTAAERAGKRWYGWVGVDGVPVGGTHPWVQESSDKDKADDGWHFE